MSLGRLIISLDGHPDLLKRLATKPFSKKNGLERLVKPLGGQIIGGNCASQIVSMRACMESNTANSGCKRGLSQAQLASISILRKICRTWAAAVFKRDSRLGSNFRVSSDGLFVRACCSEKGRVATDRTGQPDATGMGDVAFASESSRVDSLIKAKNNFSCR